LIAAWEKNEEKITRLREEGIKKLKEVIKK